MLFGDLEKAAEPLETIEGQVREAKGSASSTSLENDLFQVPEMEAYTFLRSKLLPSFIESSEYQAFLGTKYPISGSKTTPRKSTNLEDVNLEPKPDENDGATEKKTEEEEGNAAAQNSEAGSDAKPTPQQKCCTVQ